MNPTCETCRWHYGIECRRYAPRVLIEQAIQENLIYEKRQPYKAFPMMYDGEWCGEHTPKETP